MWNKWDNGIDGFREEDYKELARYVSWAWMNEEAFVDLMKEMNIDPDSIKSVKTEIAQYYKDWEIDASQNDWKIDDLIKFLKDNNPE